MEILRKYIKENGLNQKKFAESIGIQPQWLSNILNNITKPSIAIAEKIYEATNGDITIDMIRPDIARLLK
jgi:transcriptional regulator with XRE-family HTH domain